MYRVQKVLGNNAILAVQAEQNKKYLILGKGIGFGKKVSDKVTPGPEDTAYCLNEKKAESDLEKIARSVKPEFLELSDIVLKKAEERFGNIDRSILFPLADHIAFAVERLRRGETIRNPLIEDIKILFHEEFKVAAVMVPVLEQEFQVEMNEDEIGYAALHVHSALMEESVSEAGKLAHAVHLCVSKVELYTGCKLDTMSIAYNRLMNHIRYMMLRAKTGEELKVNMNDYMSVRYPEAFELSGKICSEIEQELKYSFAEAEVGYLAMHIVRVGTDPQA